MTSLQSFRGLVVGHFSTFGDLEVLKVIESWMQDNNLIYDVSPYARDVFIADDKFVNIRNLDHAQYTHLIIVCGPHTKKIEKDFFFVFERLSHCVKIGVNLTLVPDESGAVPEFDALLARDGCGKASPDLSLLSTIERRPLVGLCLATKQSEYGNRRRHTEAEAMLRNLISRHQAAILELDTSWPAWTNSKGIQSARDFEVICSRLDVLLTTRLHGLVLGLKSGVPVIALDAISGGDKVTEQANAIQWPEIFSIDTVTDSQLDEALYRCLAGGPECNTETHVGLGIQALSERRSEFDQALALRATNSNPIQPGALYRFKDRWRSFLDSQRIKQKRRKKKD